MERGLGNADVQELYRDWLSHRISSVVSFEDPVELEDCVDPSQRVRRMPPSPTSETHSEADEPISLFSRRPISPFAIDYAWTAPESSTPDVKPE